ncbi:MAG TPA: nuclear transport factor 2 family protein [Gemmatimonadales bacterium]|nr:nuclear transport factor 2 family protein [Gemmatimonadales bacterium]
MNGVDLLTRFYTAFQQKDAEGMVACYAPDVRFSDPVFPDLVGERAKGMWRMLVGRGKDLRLEFRDITADTHGGSAHWEAWYTFTSTGKPVHNIIDATFTFRDGLIATHTDRFDLYRWSRQALGMKGVLLGWTPFVQEKIRSTAASALDRYRP